MCMLLSGPPAAGILPPHADLGLLRRLFCVACFVRHSLLSFLSLSLSFSRSSFPAGSFCVSRFSDSLVRAEPSLLEPWFDDSIQGESFDGFILGFSALPSCLFFVCRSIAHTGRFLCLFYFKTTTTTYSILLVTLPLDSTPSPFSLFSFDSLHPLPLDVLQHGRPHI